MLTRFEEPNNATSAAVRSASMKPAAAATVMLLLCVGARSPLSRIRGVMTVGLVTGRARHTALPSPVGEGTGVGKNCPFPAGSFGSSSHESKFGNSASPPWAKSYAIAFIFNLLRKDRSWMLSRTKSPKFSPFSKPLSFVFNNLLGSFRNIKLLDFFAFFPLRTLCCRVEYEPAESA